MARSQAVKRTQPSADADGPCLFTAALVICSADRSIPRGAVLVRGGRVVAVAPRGDFPVRPDYREVDFGAHAAILPGFVNAHAHLEYSGLAGRLAPGPFHRWLPEMIRLKRALTPEEVASGTEEGIAAMRCAGVTTVADVSTYGVSPGLLARSGLHYGVFHEAISLAPKSDLSFLDEVAGRCAASERVGPGAPDFVGIAPHAPYTVSAAALRALRQRFHAGAGRRFCLHAGESRTEAACVLHRRGRLWQMLQRAGFYPPDGKDPGIVHDFREFLTLGRDAQGPPDLLIHGAFLTPRDLAVVAGRATLVLCPRTREFHGVTVSPWSRARRAGLAVALGTDSSVSGSSLSPWDEMRAAVTDLRISPTEAWRLSTEGGAAALGLQGRRGVVQNGSDADFIVVKLSPQTPICPETSQNALPCQKRLLSVTERSVMTSYVAGKVVWSEKVRR